jgi:hypothetical protein
MKVPPAITERVEAASATATVRDQLYKKVSTRTGRRQSLVRFISLGGCCSKELPSKAGRLQDAPADTHMRGEQSQHMRVMGIQQKFGASISRSCKRFPDCCLSKPVESSFRAKIDGLARANGLERGSQLPQSINSAKSSCQDSTVRLRRSIRM